MNAREQPPLQATLESYLEGLLEGFVAYDAGWVMTYMNAAGERLLGRRRQDVLGRTWHEAFPHAVGSPVDLMYQRVMRTRQSERMEYDYAKPYGKWMEISASPAAGGGVAVYFRDITEAKKAHEELREGEQRLRLALEAGRMGTWEWNIPEGRVRWSRDLEAMHGYEPGGFAGTAEAYAAEVYPPDRAHVEKVIADTFAGKEHRLEYRIVRRDGAVRWVEGRGKLLRDAQGNPLRLVGVCTDITERKDAEARLREADRRKDEFLATLAHELRNPLAPIAHAVEILQAKGPAEPELVHGRAVIARQVRQMARLLDDLLDVSRITAGKVELRRARVPLAGIVESAVETSRPLIDAGRHELEVTLPGRPVLLDADPVRLAQVFSNLLNNAAKYTPERGHIRVHARRSGDAVVVSVSDDGIGLAPEMLPRVFEMFAQAEPAGERSRGGLGIGLSLAKALVEMHGGGIEARSDGPGRGTEFVVRLPALADAGAAEPERPAPLAAGAPHRRFLVADDLKDAADTLAVLLRSMGHEVKVAYDGEAALAAGDALRPEIVLLDLGMPRLNGYDTCRRMRERPWGRDALIVALSGWGQEQDRRQSQDAGFDLHWVKPLEADRLAALAGSAPARASDPAREP